MKRKKKNLCLIGLIQCVIDLSFFVFRWLVGNTAVAVTKKKIRAHKMLPTVMRGQVGVGITNENFLAGSDVLKGFDSNARVSNTLESSNNTCIRRAGMIETGMQREQTGSDDSGKIAGRTAGKHSFESGALISRWFCFYVALKRMQMVLLLRRLCSYRSCLGVVGNSRL